MAEIPKIDTKLLNEIDMFLQGKHMPKGFNLTNLPNLTQEQSFTVIYVLQEWLQVIPDSFERCSACGIIYDGSCSGVYSGDTIDEMNEWIDAGYDFDEDDIRKHFCGNCK